MPDRDLVGRVMVLENTIRYTLPRIEEYMKQGIEQRVSDAKCLASVEETVKGFRKYEEICTIERKNLNDRTGIIEKQFAKQKGMAAAIAVILTGFGNLLAVFWPFKHG